MDEEFKKQVRRIMKEMGFSEPEINQFLNGPFGSDFFPDMWLPFGPEDENLRVKEKKRPFYDVIEYGQKIQICIELKDFKARSLKELDYKMEGNLFSIRDRLTNRGWLIRLPYQLNPIPLGKPSYVNKIFSIYFEKRKI